MTMISGATIGRFGHGLRPSLGARLFATVGTWRRRAQERAELAGLNDRLLCDIGLSRADAEFIVNKPFWKE